jgi:hypothetical protein
MLKIGAFLPKKIAKAVFILGLFAGTSQLRAMDNTHVRRGLISPGFIDPYAPARNNKFFLIIDNPLTVVLDQMLRHRSDLSTPNNWTTILKILLQNGVDPNALIHITREHDITTSLLELIALTPALSEIERKDLLITLVSHGANPFAKATIFFTKSSLLRHSVVGESLYNTYPSIKEAYDFIKRAKRERLAEKDKKRSAQEIHLLGQKEGMMGLPPELADYIFDIERKLPTSTPEQQKEQRERNMRIEQLNLDRELEEIERQMREEHLKDDNDMMQVD